MNGIRGGIPDSGSSLFSVGEREKAGEIWNSRTQEVTARQANETGEEVFN
jgi:hypothetical protein